VLEGEFAFGLGPGGAEHVSAPAQTLVLIPHDLVHTFWTPGPADARFLNIHAPSRRFAESLRVRRDAGVYDATLYDSFDPPAGGGRPASAAVVRVAGAGDSIAIGPSKAVFKAEGSDGDGTFSLSETTIAPGFPGPVPHVHETLVDSFYVLAGTLTVILGDRNVEADAGAFVFVPPGNVHTFANPGSEEVRVLNLMAPGGFEQYLKELAHSLPADGPPDPLAMAEIASRYDFRPA
jgi:mannose-6-phosphate isomerase-like protein (cupin superfamily)